MFYKDKKVLVTGGTGFVGTHFVQALLEQGATVRIPVHKRQPLIKHESIETVSADLNNLADCLKVCEGIDYVIHAAGFVGGAGVSTDCVISGISGNLILTARVLEAAYTQNIKRILIFSSSTAYPASDYSVTEDELWHDFPPSVYFGYGWMRRYFELFSQLVADKSNIKVALCRPTAIYGRYDNFDSKTSHVIPSLIRRIVAKENPIIVWGTGQEKRDFLHVTDLVRGCLLLLEKNATCDPVNIGYGEAITIENVVKIIQKAANHENVDVIYDDSKPSSLAIRMVDTAKAKRILGFEPIITLESGIQDTVNWYIQELKK